MKPPMDIMYSICSHFASGSEVSLSTAFSSACSNNVPCAVQLPGGIPLAGASTAWEAASIRRLAVSAVLS